MEVVVEEFLVIVRTGVVSNTFADAKIIVVVGVVIASKLAVPIPYSVALLSDVVVDMLNEMLIGAAIDFVADIKFEVVADVSVSVFTAVVTDLEFDKSALSLSSHDYKSSQHYHHQVSIEIQ